MSTYDFGESNSPGADCKYGNAYLKFDEKGKEI